jgi:hypothetical protein
MYKSVQYTEDGKLILELPDDFTKKPLDIYVIPREDENMMDLEELNCNSRN